MNYFSSGNDLSYVKISPASIVMSDNALTEKVINDFISAVKNEKFGEGVRPVFLVEEKILHKYRQEFKPLTKLDPLILFFNGECSIEEVGRLYNEFLNYKNSSQNSIVVVFAAGGGKLLDTSKLLSARIGSSSYLVTIPTSCATCAAFTPIAPTYYPDGRKRKTIDPRRPPDLMIVDYRILIRQPPRLMVSGIADAVAKYYETRAYIQSLIKKNESISQKISPSFLLNKGILSAHYEDLSVRTAEAVSSEIVKGAFEFSHEALNSITGGKITEKFRQMVYLTLIMPGIVSGVGGKKCRTVAAHALANGLTYLPDARNSLHGEKVSWGTLVQLVLEKKYQELEELRSFFVSIKAPVRLKMLLENNKPLTYRLVKKAFEVACAPDESMRFMPLKVSPRMAYDAACYVENM